ncbi:hypothetical protein PR048_022343 [Dryococelus australis]|uniref:Vacuolar protein sorting-associated protein 13 VPS13 adaptor binding domain-containing protein n=1 Tax=Dryococelus australis TaxID=614101 RepID=A0ABQ9H0T4_9NEOP|nr:hypothetical protein PR048_022343 [Dryococelus australis]
MKMLVLVLVLEPVCWWLLAQALCEEGAAVNRVSRAIPNYLVKLLPPLAIHNRLPYAVEVKIPSIHYEVRIEAGEKTNIYFLNLLNTHKICVEVSSYVHMRTYISLYVPLSLYLPSLASWVPQYLGSPWTGWFSLTPDLEEKTVTMTTEYDTEGGNKQLGLSLRVDRTGTCALYLHAPYWIINKTGLPLQIRSGKQLRCEHVLEFRRRTYMRRRWELAMTDGNFDQLSVGRGVRGGRRGAAVVLLQEAGAPASCSYPRLPVLLVVGVLPGHGGLRGVGVWRDRERRRRYRVLLTVTVARLCPQLSRIVTLLPNFLVANNTRKHLRFMEENERSDLWIDLAPGQCTAFWPETDSMKMYVKFRDSKLVSQHFPITQTHQTVLRMDKGVHTGGDIVGHEGIQTLDILLGKILPHLAQVILQIWRRCHWPRLPFNLIPNVFDGLEIWNLYSRPITKADQRYLCCVRRGIVLLENGVVKLPQERSEGVSDVCVRCRVQCGLCVEVSGGGERPFSVTFRGYSSGDAPVRVDNLCEDLFLKIHQQDLGQVALLSPYQSVLYTWDDPCRERTLLWNVYNNKGKGFLADIRRVSIECTPHKKIYLYEQNFCTHNTRIRDMRETPGGSAAILDFLLCQSGHVTAVLDSSMLVPRTSPSL